MASLKVVTILGARPQFIKASPVSREIQGSSGLTEVLVHTGQHFHANMSDIFFRQMGIPEPDYHLGVNSLSHGAMTGRMLEQVEGVLLREKPHWVMVYGDTNSTLAGALAAKKLHIKVAHVEAGLRSHNMNMPEEVNRILTDRISDLLLCPVPNALKNLEAEGFSAFPSQVVLSGDVMQDAANYYRNQSVKPQESLPERFVLATVHRAENTGSVEKLTAIFRGLEAIGSHCPVVLPLHPGTRKKMAQYGIAPHPDKVHIISPVGYLEVLYLLENAEMVITDSGGMQKEAYFFNKQCITLRGETEWTELVEHGFNRLCKPGEDDMLQVYLAVRDQQADPVPGLYGGGKAAVRIVSALLNYQKEGI